MSRFQDTEMWIRRRDSSSLKATFQFCSVNATFCVLFNQFVHCCRYFYSVYQINKKMCSTRGFLKVIQGVTERFSITVISVFGDRNISIYGDLSI